MIGSRVGDVAGVRIARRDEAVDIRSGRAAEYLMGRAGIGSGLGKIMIFQLDIKDGANFIAVIAVTETVVMTFPIAEMVTVEKPTGIIGEQGNSGHEGGCQGI